MYEGKSEAAMLRELLKEKDAEIVVLKKQVAELLRHLKPNVEAERNEDYGTPSDRREW